MRIELATCPHCNSDMKINVPDDRILSGVQPRCTNECAQEQFCPQCGRMVHIEYRESS